MSDALHSSLSAFRDTMLTAVAKLEFELRDIITNNSKQNSCNTSSSTTTNLENILNTFIGKFEHSLETNMMKLSLASNIPLQTTKPNDFHETLPITSLLETTAPLNSKNILIKSVTNTPALAAAVAAANNIPSISLFDTLKHDELKKSNQVVIPPLEIAKVNETVTDDFGTVEESESELELDTEPTFIQIVIKGKQYYMNPDDKHIYIETEDSYEEIGVYNPKTNSIDAIVEEEVEEEEVVEEEVVEEVEEEEVVEVEDFIFKGTTYQKDVENNVYLDGEHIGMWNGKKIIKTA